MKAFKYKLLPTKKQETILRQWCGACRFVYNAGLEHRNINYTQFKKSVYYHEQATALPIIKKEEGFEWLKEVPSQSLQSALKHLEKAFGNFFQKKSDYPQYKKKNGYGSVHFPTPTNFNIAPISNKKCVVNIPKIGLIKFRKHRDWEGVIRNATISKDGNAWYISFCCKVEIVNSLVPLGEPVGLDKGIVHTIATSQGDFFDLPVNKIKKLEKKIGKFQRKCAKQTKFGVRWKYFKKIINKLHRKITRMRHDWLHKLSYTLTNNHSLIVTEALKVTNMSKSSKGTLEEPGKNVAQKSGLNRSILRQGWGTLQRFLEYKGVWYGSTVIKVDPKNTSRTCSKCGHVSKENRKTQERFSCMECGHEENADTNAAKVILRLGLKSQVPSTGSPVVYGGE